MIFFYRDVNEDELTQLFSAYGNIVQMNLLKDKITGMPRGVAFVRLVPPTRDYLLLCSILPVNNNRHGCFRKTDG